MEKFSFDLKTANPEQLFGDVKNNNQDSRFFKLTTDKEGYGTAVIRFLPDADGEWFKMMYRNNVNTTKNGVRRWLQEWSPKTIGLADPITEEWSRLYNSPKTEDKEKARSIVRQVRYIANVRVVDDPENPENNGKNFLMDMPRTLKERAQKIMFPPAQKSKYVTQSKQLCDPMDGYDFIVICEKGTNGVVTYEPSQAAEAKTSLYTSEEEYVKDILNNTHKLSEFHDPSFFKTYEELKEQLDNVMFRDLDANKASAPVATLVSQETSRAQEVAPATVITQAKKEQIEVVSTSDSDEDALQELLADL